MSESTLVPMSALSRDHRDGVLKISATIATVATSEELEDAVLSLRELTIILKEADDARKKIKNEIETTAKAFVENVESEKLRLTGLVNHYQRKQIEESEERDRAARIVLESLARDAVALREIASKSGDADDVMAADLADEELELAKQTTGLSLLTPTATPRGLGVKVEFGYEITDPYLLVARMPNFFLWKEKEQSLHFVKKEFSKYLNTEPLPDGLLPKDGEDSITHEFGIRIFRDVKTSIRTKVSRADVGTPH